MKKSLKILVCLLALTVAGDVLAQSQTFRLCAHRGSRFEYDENTLESFKATYDAGLRGFETDIRISSDGEMIVSHDETFTRLTDCTRTVESMTAAEIRKIRTKQGNRVATLTELADFFADKDNIYVEFEMKTNAPLSSYPEDKLREYCAKLYDMTMPKKAANSTYFYTSSDKRALRMMRSLHPEANLLLIISKPICNDTILEAIDLGVNWLGCKMGGTSREAVQLANKAGIHVSLWPSSKAEDIMLGAYLGAETLVCDRAVEVKKFLDEKATWIKYR